MNDNNVRTSIDKPVTVRIPLDLLQAIENKAGTRYPSRKGEGGNRSQVMLDALVFYQSHQWGEKVGGTEKKLSDDNIRDVVENLVSQRIESLADSLEYLIEKALDKRLQSVQGIVSEGDLQGTQDNTNETVESLQSVQSIVENKPSEDALEAPLNDIQVLEAIGETEGFTEAISEGEPEKPDNQEFDEETEVKKAIANKDKNYLLKIANRKLKPLGVWEKMMESQAFQDKWLEIGKRRKEQGLRPLTSTAPNKNESKELINAFCGQQFSF